MLQLRDLRVCGLAPLVALGLQATVTPASTAVAQDLGKNWETTSEPAGVGSREIWFGADAGAHNWLVYSGSTYAPFGDIHADGLRLRASSGYGQYSYRFDINTPVKAYKTTADVMIGYQYRIGELTAKAFFGWAMLNNEFDVPARSLHLQKFENGAKGALELWLNLGASAWTSLDFNYADTRSTWSVRSRTGYRVLPTVSLGIEGAFNHSDLTGEVQASTKFSVEGNTRVGAFARYEWFGGEISASGGYSGDWIERKGANAGTDILNRPQVYGTVNLIIQY